MQRILVLLVLTALALKPCEAQNPVKRDTSLFVYQANKLVMKEHGDTIWMTRPERSTRIIDTGDRIWLRRHTVGSVPEEIAYVVRGDTAYPSDSTRKQVALSVLRTYRFQIESARRVAALATNRNR